MTCSCQSQQVEESLVDLVPMQSIYESVPLTEGYLISVLQKAQEIYGYLPRNVLSDIAEKMKLKPAKVYGVATFYAQFRMKPTGKYLIMLCQGTACHVNGSGKIEQAIVEELKISDGETTADGLFTFTNVACLGCCSLAPVMVIGNQTYAKLTPERTKEVLRDLKALHKEVPA